MLARSLKRAKRDGLVLVNVATVAEVPEGTAAGRGRCPPSRLASS